MEDTKKEGFKVDDIPPDYETPPLDAYKRDSTRPSNLKAGLPTPGTNTPRPAFEFVMVSEMKVEAPKYLIQGHIETNCNIMIFGEQSSGKSFLAIDIACCVATGKSFHGFHVRNNKGSVLYVAGEGHSGLSRRFAAWGAKHGLNLWEIPVHVSRKQAELTDKDSTESIIRAINEMPEKPCLIVIDTLNRNFGQGDESSTKDMTAFVKNLDIIRESAKGASLLLVHHPGVGDKNRPRGSSVLYGSLDCEYVFRNDEHGIRRLECLKMKDGCLPEPMAFEMNPVDLGIFDEFGNPVTSAVFNTCGYKPLPPKQKGSKGSNALNSIPSPEYLKVENHFMILREVFAENERPSWKDLIPLAQSHIGNHFKVSVSIKKAGNYVNHWKSNCFIKQNETGNNSQKWYYFDKQWKIPMTPETVRKAGLN